MGYYVQCYLTSAEAISRVFGAQDIALYEELAAAFAAEFARHNEYFARHLPENVTYQSLLIDLVYGALRFPGLAFAYGYIYERLCRYYGAAIYPSGGELSTNYYWAIKKTPKAFIPIPFSPDFPEIYSIHRADLEIEKACFLAITEIEGLPPAAVEEMKEDYEFVFDKAVAENRDLVFLTY